MAYRNDCGTCPRLNYWSNPDVLYNGIPMGTSILQNNARVWNGQSNKVINFRQPPSSATLSRAGFSDTQYADIVAKKEIIVSGDINVSSTCTLHVNTNSYTMKIIKPFILLFSLSLTVCACEKEKKFELKYGDTFSIKNGCGTVSYESNIGKDFASARDSIKRLYERTCPWLWADSIETDRLNVDFPHDNRLFWSLTAKEKYLPSPLPVYTGVDVVDSKGNHYKFWPCD